MMRTDVSLGLAIVCVYVTLSSFDVDAIQRLCARQEPSTSLYGRVVWKS